MRTHIKFGQIAIGAAARSVLGKNSAKRYFQESIMKLPGLGAKLGQFFGTYNKDLTVSAPEPLPIMDVKKIIHDECTALFESIAWISEEAMPASIGQVHKAGLRDGREVAIKVQYPGIEVELKSQLQMFLKALSLSPARKFGIDVEDYRLFLNEKFTAELDYLEEGKTQSRFVREFRQFSDCLIIPDYIPELSSQRVLVQEFVASNLINELKDAPAKDKKEIVDVLGRFLLQQIFVSGLIHTDLHRSNFGYVRSGGKMKVVLYDFGSVLELSRTQIEVLQHLVQSYRGGASVAPYNSLCSLGFDAQMLSHIEGKLPALCEKLLEPLLLDQPMRPNEWLMNEYFSNVLQEDSWWFRSAGPAWFLYLMRSVFHTFSAIDDINFAVNLYRLWPEFEISLPSDFRQTDFSNHLSDKLHNLSDKAKRLRVRVVDGSVEKVSLQLPMTVVENLEDVLPDAVKQKIETRYDLTSIKRSVQRSGYLPTTLFELKDGSKNYKVWLE